MTFLFLFLPPFCLFLISSKPISKDTKVSILYPVTILPFIYKMWASGRDFLNEQGCGCSEPLRVWECQGAKQGPWQNKTFVSLLQTARLTTQPYSQVSGPLARSVSPIAAGQDVPGKDWPPSCEGVTWESIQTREVLNAVLFYCRVELYWYLILRKEVLLDGVECIMCLLYRLPSSRGGTHTGGRNEIFRTRYFPSVLHCPLRKWYLFQSLPILPAPLAMFSIRHLECRCTANIRAK